MGASRQLAQYKWILGKLAIPVAPKLHPACLQALRPSGVAGTAVEAGQRFIQTRESIGVSQIGQRVRLGGHDLLEELRVGVEGALQFALPGLVVRQRAQSGAGPGVEGEPFGGIVLRLFQDREGGINPLPGLGGAVEPW